MAWTQERYTEFVNNYGNFFLSKKFYVITPTQDKIPLSEVCNHRPLKTMGDLGEPGRLVLVVECDTVNPDGTETVYWKQAFYFSTGTSSAMKHTWFPFDGLVFGTYDSIREENGRLGIMKPMPGDIREVTHQLWLDKSPFVRSSRGNPPPDTPEGDLALVVYDGGFLPEEMYGDRFGSFSYAMASYMLGGGAWSRGGLDVRRLIYGASRNLADYPGLLELDGRLSPPRPALDCFVEMVSVPDRIPFSNIADINDYIARNKAVSYMGSFWGTAVEGLIPPPSEFAITAFFGKNSYRIPFYVLLFDLRQRLYKLLISIQTGKTPADAATVEAAIRQILASVGNIPLLSDKPVWNFLQNQDRFKFMITPLQAKQIHMFGGRRKTRRWKMPRKYTRRYCKKTPCKRMGFTQRSSCRPYKNCF